MTRTEIARQIGRSRQTLWRLATGECREPGAFSILRLQTLAAKIKPPPDLPTYAELFTTLKERGVGVDLISERMGVRVGSLQHLRSRNRADPKDPRYQALARLARACRKVYGSASL